MSNLFKFLSQILLSISLYLSGWYIEGSMFQVIQISAIMLLMAAGFFAAISREVPALSLTIVEYIFGAAFLLATIVAFVHGNVLSTMYGLLFFLVVLSISVLVRYYEWLDLSLIFRRVYIALLATILIVEPDSYFKSVVGTVEYGVGLVRFEPLGMHPNLSGFVYGGGTLLFLQSFLVSRNIRDKLVSIIFSALCFSIILAASARASLLAVGMTVLIASMYMGWRGDFRIRAALAVLIFLSSFLMVFYIQEIFDYLTIVLDLESDTRGVESGATGRTDIWMDGVSLIIYDTFYLFFGRGVRAAGPDVIGFPVESSYINLALEHGVIVGAVIAMVFVITAFRALSNSTRVEGVDFIIFINGLMIIFALIQSIFNRYLLAIGNPFSLLLLFLLLSLGLKKIRNPS